MPENAETGPAAKRPTCNVPFCKRPVSARGLCRRHYQRHYKGREDWSAYMTHKPNPAYNGIKPHDPDRLAHHVAAGVAHVLGLTVRQVPPPVGVTVITGPDGRTALITRDACVVLMVDR